MSALIDEAVGSNTTEPDPVETGDGAEEILDPLADPGRRPGTDPLAGP